MGVGDRGLKRSWCRVRRRFLGMGGRYDGKRERESEGGRERMEGWDCICISDFSFFFTVTDNTPPVGWLMKCEACIVLFCVYIYDVYFIWRKEG